MKRWRISIFFRFLILSMLIGCTCIYWSIAAFRSLNREARLEFKRQSDLFLIRVLDEQNLEPSAQLRRFEGLRDQLSILSSQIWIFNDQGQLLAKNSEQLPPPVWKQLVVPQTSHEFIYEGLDSNNGKQTLGAARLKQKNHILVTLEDPRSLLRKLAIRFGFFMAGFVLFGILVICLLVLFYLRQKGKIAESVFAAIQKGDLQKRFPVSKFDSLTRVMNHFNFMADELVRVIESTKTTEQARLRLLQELSHDLRTPIAAIRGLIENLHDYSGRLTPSESNKLLLTAKGEAAYLQNLLDDLFFLAEMNEPKYRTKTEELLVAKILASEMQVFNGLAHKKNNPVKFKLNVLTDESQLWVLGDSSLIRRGFRNVFDNCLRYAQSEVMATVSINQTPAGDKILVAISDDGPGFSAEMLNSLQMNNHHHSTGQSKKSLGLQISRHIFRLHGGTISISNRLNQEGKILGAEYILTLDKTTTSPMEKK